METAGHGRRFWLVFGIVILAIPGSHLLRFFTQRADIWWTPRALSVPLAESADRVEIYVQGRSLQEQLGARRLQLVTDRGPSPLDVADVTLRFNNRDRVRAGQIPGLLIAALVSGAAGVFVVLSALGKWPPAGASRQGQS